jgi:hypothetical protein
MGDPASDSSLRTFHLTPIYGDVLLFVSIYDWVPVPYKTSNELARK